MKVREKRLRAILQTIASSSVSVDGTRLAGRVCREFAVAPSTAYQDIRDLLGRGWVLREWGRLTITQAGLREVNPIEA